MELKQKMPTLHDQQLSRLGQECCVQRVLPNSVRQQVRPREYVATDRSIVTTQELPGYTIEEGKDVLSRPYPVQTWDMQRGSRGKGVVLTPKESFCDKLSKRRMDVLNLSG